MEHLSFKDNYFDIVVCNNAIAYTDKEKSLKEIVRVLKKGGYCISLFNNAFDYSLYKIRYPNKSWPTEIIHTLAVIINTLLYKLLNKKIFRTTFNTYNEINKLLDKNQVSAKEVFIDNKTLPYKTFKFVFMK